MKFGLDKARTFWVLLIGLTLWKVFLAGNLDIIQDEGYYYYWSLFPQLSYFDHPPLTAWSMTLARQLFGDTIWSVRFWPLAAGFVFPIIGRALARVIFSHEISNRAGILLMLCPVFAGNGLLMTPDALFALFWANRASGNLQSPPGNQMEHLLVAAGRTVGRIGIFVKIQYGTVLFWAGDLVSDPAGQAIPYFRRWAAQRDHRPDRFQPGADLELPA